MIIDLFNISNPIMGVKGERVPFDIANQIAIELAEFFSKWGEVTIVGSIRRKEKDVGDIDFVLLPTSKDLRVIDLIRALPEDEVEHVQGFNHMAIAIYKYNGCTIPINIWITSKESEGATIFAYTGPKGYTIGYRNIAKKKGLLLNEKGLFKNGQLIAGRTEEEIYKALDKEWKIPEIRGKR